MREDMVYMAAGTKEQRTSDATNKRLSNGYNKLQMWSTIG